MKDYLPLIQTGLWIVLILFGILIFRKPVNERFKGGGSLKIGPVEFGALAGKVDDVQQEVSQLGKKVSELFLLTMSEPMYMNLKKLSSDKFGDYKMGEVLKRELYHLRDIGYIDVASIGAIPSQGDNLSGHVVVTDTGRKFVDLRESVRRPSS